MATYSSFIPSFITLMSCQTIPVHYDCSREAAWSQIIIIIINKVLIKVTLNKVIAGALYIVICG